MCTDQSLILSESFLNTKSKFLPKTFDVTLMNTDEKFIHWRIDIYGSLTDKLINHLKKNGYSLKYVLAHSVLDINQKLDIKLTLGLKYRI